ncbi:MAG: carboxylesterase, partial [Candidatus Tagabacteria bacterium CG_4_10_14_0_2_um_filter_40_13]
MKAAVRYFRKDAATANLYKVDPNVAFIGGISAGSFIGIYYSYLDQPSEIPTSIDT